LCFSSLSSFFLFISFMISIPGWNAVCSTCCLLHSYINICIYKLVVRALWRNLYSRWRSLAILKTLIDKNMMKLEYIWCMYGTHKTFYKSYCPENVIHKHRHTKRSLCLSYAPLTLSQYENNLFATLFLAKSQFFHYKNHGKM
jgi:hypothetical protein